MKIRIVLLLSLMVLSVTAFGQTPATIEKTEISGISDDKLSAALRADLSKLVGQPYNASAAAQIAERIQAELPEYVATPTTTPGTQADRVRLIFSVAHNINSKYIVEAVELQGIERSKISDDLWAAMQKMVGHPVDDAEADRLRDKLAEMFKKKGPHVRRSVVKGTMPQHVKIVYEGHLQNSFGFSFSNSDYQSREKFSGAGSLSYAWMETTGIKIDAVNNSSELIERVAGFRYGYWAGYKRVRATIAYSSFRAQWSNGTLSAAKAAGGGGDLYRLRDTLAPSVELKITPDFNITLGVMSTELQLQSPRLHFQSVRTATGKVSFSLPVSHAGKEKLSTSYEIHVAGDTLNSDATYTRHVWTQGFGIWKWKNPPSDKFFSFGLDRLAIDFREGRITGNAPMFERFSIGSSTAVTGWNKYEITPLGGTREAYGSVSLTGKYGIVSYENGAVWNNGQPKVLRKSVGTKIFLGTLLHAPMPLRIIMNMAPVGMDIPLRGSHVRPIYTLGFGGGY